MNTPDFLKEGDEIRLIAPSRFIEEDLLEKATIFYEKNDLKVSFGAHILEKDNQFAGSTEKRAEDLQTAIDDENVKAIIAFRGGYGAAKIVDMVNWENFKKSPKWFCGYSDACAIHSHIQSLGICSLHSTMPVHITETKEEHIMSFYAQLEVLKGESIEYYLEYEAEFPIIEGKIIGGNLSVLYSVLNSKSDFDWNNHILFLEDLDEYLYHIDRMMNGLQRATKLQKLKAIVLGGLTDMNDNKVPFGKDAEEIISTYAKKNKTPIFYGLPTGHQPLNLPIKLGHEVKIEGGVMVYKD